MKFALLLAIVLFFWHCFAELGSQLFCQLDNVFLFCLARCIVHVLLDIDKWHPCPDFVQQIHVLQINYILCVMWRINMVYKEHKISSSECRGSSKQWKYRSWEIPKSMVVVCGWLLYLTRQACELLWFPRVRQPLLVWWFTKNLANLATRTSVVDGVHSAKATDSDGVYFCWLRSYKGHIKVIQHVSYVISIIFAKYNLNPSINKKVMTIKAKLKRYDLDSHGQIKVKVMSKLLKM